MSQVPDQTDSELADSAPEEHEESQKVGREDPGEIAQEPGHTQCERRRFLALARSLEDPEGGQTAKEIRDTHCCKVHTVEAARLVGPP